MNHYSHFSTLCLFVLIAESFLPSARSSEKTSTQRAVESITASELRKHVDVLADDTFEGRRAGSRGGKAASMYLVKEFEKQALKPAGTENGYLQSFGNGYRNILGLLEGSDSTLKEEVIVVGAHFDHVGYGSRRNSFGPLGYIHNGADDNASGTAGVLETIDAFKKLSPRPKRSILFALWDGEEMGLLGSKHWLAQPTIPLDRVKCVVNVDMIGRLRKKVDVYGVRTGSGLRRTVASANSGVGLNLNFTWEMKENSDHYPFFQHNIPALMFHTGLHDDYHRPSDDAHKVNVEGMQNIVRLLFETTKQIADGPAIGAFRKASKYETVARQRGFESPLDPSPPRLGVWMQNVDNVVELTRIVARSAADRGGLRSGDRIIEINGVAIHDRQQLVSTILQSPPKADLEVKRANEDEPLRLAVQLDGNPVRIGISWREDQAAPGTVMLTKIISGSPAHLASLQIRDRIYAVDGKTFRNSDELLELMNSQPSPIEILTERQGRMRLVQLEVPAPFQKAVESAE